MTVLEWKPRWLTCPIDPRDGAQWDQFWEELLSSKDTYMDSVRMDFSFFRLYRWFATFRELGLTRIVFPGNGISALPHCLCIGGFEVLAFDISRTAIGYSLTNPPGEWLIFNFFCYPFPRAPSYTGEDREATSLLARQAVHRAHRPGGSLEYRVEDVFTYEPVDGSMDVIFLMHLAEHFSDSDLQLLVERLFRWLAPGGIVLVEDSSIEILWGRSAYPGTLQRQFEEAGFLIALKDVYSWWQTRHRRRWWQVLPRWNCVNATHEEYAELKTRAEAALAADFDALRRGQKMVMLTPRLWSDDSASTKSRPWEKPV